MEGNKIMAALIVMAMVLSTIVVLNTFDVKIAGNASAQPGVDEWGNATTDLVYDTTYASGAIKINTSLWGDTGTYYLYYPIYTSSGAGPNADSFSWGGPYKVGGASVKVVSTQGNTDALDTSGTSISFNRSGMWIFDNNSAHNATDSTTYGGYIWVNSSTEYVISSVADVLYNSSGSKTITVDTGDDVGCMISIVAPDNTTVYHKWRATSTSEAIGIKGNFSIVGDYRVLAYRDLDEQTSTYLYQDGETNYEAYNSSYGSGGSFPADATYNYANQGPFDPPEKNATEATFTVNTGEPNIVLTNDSNIDWGFALKMEVNVTDDDGAGIPGGTVRLKNSTAYIANGTYSKIWINDTLDGNYTIEIPRYAGGANDWAHINNGTWRVVFSMDINSDGTDEWNNSKKISIKSSSPPVRINIDNDGSGKSTDKKVDIPTASPDLTGPAEVINISFTIMGRSISDDQGRAYYGDDLPGENYKNITISGDILYPIHLYSGSKSGTLLNNGGGSWSAAVTPTKPGGTITIAIDWPGSNNGSASETIEIINGTQVTTSVESFTVGEHINLTVTVKDMDGDPIKTSWVILFWAGHSTTPGAINSTNGTNKAGNGQNGEYTFWITPDDQGSTAPENITVAAKWKGAGFWGYGKVVMEKNHNMVVNCTPTTAYAGDNVEYDIDISLVDGGNPEKTGLTVALYNETGALVTDATDAWSRTGAYDINDEEIPLTGGMYYLFAYNDTHDSRGHNATIIVTPYNVVSSPSVLAWLVDTSTNMTFQVTPAGNGTLYVENMSTTPNASSAGETETVEIENGVGTLEGVNATTLGNITFDYQSEDGEQRPATGLVHVTTATATPNPATVYIGEPTIVEITITHPATGTPLQGVRIGLDHNVALNESLGTLMNKIPNDGFTDAAGKVLFSIETGGSGNITIYVENMTDPDNPFVIKSSARKTMQIYTDPTVNEGDTFIVTAKSGGVVITDSTVTMEFAGTTLTTTDGTVEFTAPSVQDSVNYMVQATADGYTSDDATIKVLNVRKLVIVITSTEVSGGSAFDVTIADDAGSPVIGATITINQKTYKTGAQGTTTITAPGEQGDYIITATFPGYTDADPYTITIKAGQIPGFELLTLIAAIGVAFILLRRRRN